MTIFSFDSWEEMQDHLAQRSAAAQAAMTQEQRSLTWGSYAMMPTANYIVFGYLFTQEEVRLGEIESGAGQEEAESTVRATQAMLDRGLLYGRWYSPLEPSGELGTNHAVSCWPINPHEFAIAATFGYDARQVVRAPEGVWLLDKFVTFAQERAHAEG